MENRTRDAVSGPGRPARPRDRARERERTRSRSREAEPNGRRPRRSHHPARSVMVFPTRDGDHIVVTVTVGMFYKQRSQYFVFPSRLIFR